MPHTLTIAQLTDQLANRKLSSREATQACLDRIDDVDHRLNAFINLDPEQALMQADAADTAIAQGRTHVEQPLLGVPIAIKDNLCVRGMRTIGYLQNNLFVLCGRASWQAIARQNLVPVTPTNAPLTIGIFLARQHRFWSSRHETPERSERRIPA